MWIICQADDSHEMSRLVFFVKWKKKKKLSSAAVVTGALRVKWNFNLFIILIGASRHGTTSAEFLFYDADILLTVVDFCQKAFFVATP